MSHIVKIKTQVRDPVAVSAACGRLKLLAPVRGEFQLFNATVAGLGVCLPGWKYPVVCDMDTGEVRLDNFGGRWGEQVELDRFVQAYAVEKAKMEARRKGHAVVEQALADGSIKLTIQVAGGVA